MEKTFINTIKTNKTWLDNELFKLGYKINNSMSFNYYNNLNSYGYEARSCYIVERNTNLSFCNINARRDDNFKKLQKLRLNDYLINNRIYEL